MTKSQVRVDEMQCAFDEAATHLELLAGCNGLTNPERVAYRVAAKRIRRLAKRIKAK